MTQYNDLSATIKQLTTLGKGILAADESIPTITKRFKHINLESTEEHRRAYRSLLCTTPGLEEFVCGVILFEETLQQKSDDGTPLPHVLQKRGIVPGIKVDKGLIDLPNSHDEKVTQGLDGLGDRLLQYKELGARFAKWRAVFQITAQAPSMQAIHSNAENLARYAALCQFHGIVPIVEPELLMDGDHDVERSREVTERILTQVFLALKRHAVSLEHMVLKPNMAISGQDHAQDKPSDVAQATVLALSRSVPAAVPTINFLSGGQGPEQATANLQAINTIDLPRPWHLSFSYGRALQEPCLNAWGGKAENVKAAQIALYTRAKLNSLAILGKYTAELEKAA